jgi:hypothetical protein
LVGACTGKSAGFSRRQLSAEKVAAFEAERLSRPEVDHKFEFGGKFDRQVRGFGASENMVNVEGSAPI